MILKTNWPANLTKSRWGTCPTLPYKNEVQW